MSFSFSSNTGGTGFGQQQQSNMFGTPQKQGANPNTTLPFSPIQPGGSSSQPQSGGMFGNTGSAQPSSGGLFGNTGSTQPSSGGMFGNTGSAQPSSGGMFGNTGSAQPSSGGLFGNTGSAQPSSGGLFGNTSSSQSGGMFGSAAPAQSGGAFGSSTTTPAGGMFGSSTTPQTGGLFGSSALGQSGGMFGSQTTPQFGGAATNSGGSLFGNTQASSGGGMFGASTGNMGSSMSFSQNMGTHQNQLQQHQQNIPANNWFVEVQDIVDAYNTQNTNCRFISAVYDPIRPGQGNLSMAWPGMLADLYEDSKLANPDPEKYAPFPIVGAQDLETRVGYQASAEQKMQEETKKLKDSIKNAEDHLFNIRQTKIPQLQLEMSDLSHRLLKIVKILECLRGTNSHFSSGEHEMLNQLTDVGRVLEQLPQKLSELKASIDHPSYLINNNNNSRTKNSLEEALENDETRDRIYKLFSSNKKTINELKSLLQKDMQDCALIQTSLNHH